MSHRFNSSYGLNGPAPFYNNDAPESDGFLGQVRSYTSKIEDFLDNISEPIKP